MKYQITLLLIGIFLLGCTTKKLARKDKVVTIVNEFNAKEVGWFKNSGSGAISGKARFRSKNGEIRYGEEFTIELMPYSNYSKERLGSIYQRKASGYVYLEDGVPKFIPDPEGYHQTRKTWCGKDGSFRFDNLPAGEYYVIAFMLWDKENVKTGGGIMRRIVLAEGATKVVEMTNF